MKLVWKQCGDQQGVKKECTIKFDQYAMHKHNNFEQKILKENI